MWAIKFVPEAKKTSFPHDCIVWVCLFGWFVCLVLLLVSTEIPWHRLLIMSDNYIRACHDLGEGCWRILHCQGPIPGRDGFAGVRSCVLCFESECFVSEQGKVIPGSPGVERSRGSCTSQHWAQQGDVMKLQPQLVDIRMSMQAFCSLQWFSFYHFAFAFELGRTRRRKRGFVVSLICCCRRCRRCCVVVVANQKPKNSYLRNLISEHDPRTDCTLRNAPSRSRSRKRRRKRSSFAAQIFACLLREFHPDSWAFFTLISSWASLSCVKKKVKFEQRQEEEKEVDFGAT